MISPNEKNYIKNPCFAVTHGLRPQMILSGFFLNIFCGFRFHFSNFLSKKKISVKHVTSYYSITFLKLFAYCNIEFFLDEF